MLSGQPDHYAVLGVLRDASAEEIKRAYYEAARRLHPDKNRLPGETEVFLKVQQAYEVLSNPTRRAQYDATLPKEQVDDTGVHCAMQFSRPSLVRLSEPQLLYALLEASPPESRGRVSATPLNLCLVLDRSTSMQGPKMDVAKAAAVRLLHILRPEDLFSMVVFSDRAEVLLSTSYQHDLNKAQSRILSIQTGGATEMLQGLEAGFAEVKRGHDPNRGNHLILVTDGHTYGDEQACLQLAEQAAALNVCINGFGVGNDWNDIFLDALVGKTGGSSTYISDPQDIQRVLIEKFKTLARTIVDDAVLELGETPGIEMRYAFRLQPESGPIELGQTLHLGSILQDTPLQVLFEFVIDPSVAQGDAVILLEGALRAVVTARPIPFAPMRLRIERPVAESAAEEAPPQAIVTALSRLSLYRLQERARQEADAGEYESATRHLRHLAQQLQAQGHTDLSRTAILEADSVQKKQAISESGSKDMKYGTRALVLPGPERAQ